MSANVNLWAANTPSRFWHCEPDPPGDAWGQAAMAARPALNMPAAPDDLADLLAWVLGEGQFGPQHWQLTRTRRWYYRIKPFIPRALIEVMRQLHARNNCEETLLGWPVEPRFVHFQWELVKQLLLACDQQTIAYRRFWPQGNQFALVLTHDIETDKGQRYVREVADLEEGLGFRSLFNFVPERYALDQTLIGELRTRGFEVGIHGLCHDGKLFSSHDVFSRRARRINEYLRTFGATGFRSPCTLRHPTWLQELDIEYDLSFFDTDPYEPIDGGTMTIWPFFVGRFVELPYTLAQDFTLTTVLKQSTPKLWHDKVRFISQYHGMALLNTHPDYLLNETTFKVYEEFLQGISQLKNYWHALPGDVARWWRQRTSPDVDRSAANVEMGQIVLTSQGITLC